MSTFREAFLVWWAYGPRTLVEYLFPKWPAAQWGHLADHFGAALAVISVLVFCLSWTELSMSLGVVSLVIMAISYYLIHQPRQVRPPK